MFSNISIAEIVIRVPVLLISLAFHEFSHGLAAYLLGDSSARHDGRLSLNPLRHIDPFGLVCLLLFRFGWAKPVMVDPRNLKSPKQDMAIISFAGPVSNLLLAFISMLIYFPLYYMVVSSMVAAKVMSYVLMFLAECVFINISLAVFNLIPIPPLDGSKFFTALLPDRLYFKFMDAASRYGSILLLVLVFSGATSKIMTPFVEFLNQQMFFLAEKIFLFLQ